MMGGRVLSFDCNKDVSRRLLINQIKDLASIQTSLDWHRGTRKQNGDRKNSSLEKCKLLLGNGTRPLDSPVSIY